MSQPAGRPPADAGAPFGLRGVTVAFGEQVALRDVSLDVPSGQVTAVVGGDGAGKTTLLRVLAGALAPGTGEVRRPGARRIGYLSAGSGTYPDLSVAENLAFAAAGYGVPAARARERAREYLDRTGLGEARERVAGQLSGGMRQKLGVIRAMLHQPELLVLDEPTTGIDPVSRADLWWLIARCAASGTAVILATTYLDEAERAAGVLVLDEGRALAQGTPGEITAAMPGTIETAPGRPRGRAAAHAWRRGGTWRVWLPAEPAGQDGAAGSDGAAGQDGPSGQPGEDTRPGEGGPRAAGGARTASYGTATGPGEAEPWRRVAPDLQDAVIVAALAREAAADARQGGFPHRAGYNRVESAIHPVADQPLASAHRLTRVFGALTAVREVDLRVAAGEVVGLLGANGAGKTTLIRMLLGLLPPTSGEVALFGEPPSIRTRRRLGYLPQSLGLYDDLTAAENMAFAHAVFGGDGGSLPPDPALAGRVTVGRLPLGVQRRVAFAQALAHGPDLLVLDEPTSGVGTLARARLWEIIRDAADGGAGVLVTTHNMDEAHECDRLVVMADGRVVATGDLAGIVGRAEVTVVEVAGPAGAWADAFAAIEHAGAAVALVGRTLRVPGATPADVRRMIGDLPARVYPAAATLDERFLELTGPAR